MLENAVKYSPGGGKISLNLSVNRKYATVSVSNDTEKEIRREDLNNVFDRFYRSDASRNSETGGHGIGLSIAKAVVEAHGGSIEATTKTGKDFTICAVLPVKP